MRIIKARKVLLIAYKTHRILTGYLGEIVPPTLGVAGEEDKNDLVKAAELLDATASVLRSRAAELRDEAAKRGGGETGIYHECGNCGVPRFEHAGIIEKCPHCGDDEIDLSLTPEIP
jgi:rubrerythrin